MRKHSPLFGLTVTVGTVALVAALVVGAGRPRLDGTAVEPAQAQGGITAESMGAHISQIQGARHALGTQAERTKLTEVAGYIHTQLGSFGLSVEEDPVTYSGQTFPNVIGVLPGTVCPDTAFIVGAHYDSVGGSPGADDDGSGVAGMLEIARLLSAQSFQPSIEFVGFSFEEDGLVGSRHMAAEAKAAGKDILGMFSLEMIGYTCDVPGCQTYPVPIPGAPDVGNFIALVANTNSAPLLQTFLDAASVSVPGLPLQQLVVPDNGGSVPDTRRSDHAPFWDQGYQALMVTDTANYRNPNYHHASDILGTLDLEFAADVADAALATVVESVTADYDADGLVDACDACPLDPENDVDGDGICAAADNCPLVSNPGQENSDSGPPPSGAGAIGNGTGIAGDDVTVPNGDPFGDACDDDLDNDGIANASDLDPGGDITYDDNNNGNPCVPLGTDAADGGPSWDSNCNGVRDGVEGSCPLTVNPEGDDDGDGLLNTWEVCKWGTDPDVVDSDGDGLGDCVEAASTDGNSTVDFGGDGLNSARATLLPAGTGAGKFGKDGDFDLNGNNVLAGDFGADTLTVVKMAFKISVCK